ncbi:hypothetical protein C0Q44_16605 [Paenibacillus sp. PCH8]|nr:hypothetical protein C0Q44_16605 [Paenibacillus sp. PCH8]
MPNFRSKQGNFSQACRGTSRESDAAGGEKAVKDALQRVFRHDLMPTVVCPTIVTNPLWILKDQLLAQIAQIS